MRSGLLASGIAPAPFNAFLEISLQYDGCCCTTNTSFRPPSVFCRGEGFMNRSTAVRVLLLLNLSLFFPLDRLSIRGDLSDTPSSSGATNLRITRIYFRHAAIVATTTTHSHHGAYFRWHVRQATVPDSVHHRNDGFPPIRLRPRCNVGYHFSQRLRRRLHSRQG